MPNLLSDDQKQFFREAAERRKRLGIRRQVFQIVVDSAAVGPLYDYWNGWVEELGKEKATDYLLLSLRKADWALRAALDKRKRG